MKARWQTEADTAAVADTACRLIETVAREAIQDRGEFRLVVAGGSTPAATYRRLAISDQKWKRWSVYYGDERCLPPDHPDRNSQMVIASGLGDRVGRHFPIPAELGAKTAAARYRQLVKRALPFDMVLLGMGEDGHTASLFPGLEWPNKTAFAVNKAPKPPPDRVTLGITTLQDCRSMLVLITGENKAVALREWRRGANPPIAQVADVPQALILVERKCLELASDQADASAEAIE